GVAAREDAVRDQRVEGRAADPDGVRDLVHGGRQGHVAPVGAEPDRAVHVAVRRLYARVVRDRVGLGDVRVAVVDRDGGVHRDGDVGVGVLLVGGRAGRFGQRVADVAREGAAAVGAGGRAAGD